MSIIIIAAIILIIIGYVKDNPVCKTIGWVLVSIFGALFALGCLLGRAIIKSCNEMIANITTDDEDNKDNE